MFCNLSWPIIRLTMVAFTNWNMNMESFCRSNQFQFAVFWSNQCYKFWKNCSIKDIYFCDFIHYICQNLNFFEKVKLIFDCKAEMIALWSFSFRYVFTFILFYVWLIIITQISPEEGWNKPKRRQNYLWSTSRRILKQKIFPSSI